LNDPVIEDKLLISSPAHGGLVYLEGDNRATVINRRPTTGICFGNSTLIWAYQDNEGRYLVEAKDGLARQIEVSPDPLDIHDVLLATEESRIYLAATHNNQVVCLDSDYQRTGVWTLPGEKDSAHLNSIALYRGRLIASIFGRFTKHREYKTGTLGLGEVIDVRTGETLISGLSQPHSLTVKDDLLYFCSSEEKQLHVYDGEGIINTVTLPGYVRGIAIGENYIYAGISLSRNVDTAKHELESGAVAIIDRPSFQCISLKFIPFEEIYDVRIIPRFSNLLSLIAIGAEEVQKLHQTVVEQDNRIKQLSRGILSRNNQIADQNRRISNQNRKIAELDEKMSELRSAELRMPKPLRGVKSIIDALKSNYSWNTGNNGQSALKNIALPEEDVINATAIANDTVVAGLSEEVTESKVAVAHESVFQAPVIETASPVLVWQDDLHLKVNDVNFRLTWDIAELHGGKSLEDDFLLGKSRAMVEKAVEIGQQQKISKVFEMGIFKGGSVALYEQIFQPLKIAAIDYMPEPVNALTQYITRHGKSDVVKPYYGVSQADREAMERILSAEFPDRDINLIVDDASHLYEETRDAFSISFPYLTPGGLYIIEDWAWAHWPGDAWQGSTSFFYGKTSLSNLLIELFMLAATRPDFIKEILINHNSIFVKKGDGVLPTRNFNIADQYLLRGKKFGAWL
jgi:hypothetical protein